MPGFGRRGPRFQWISLEEGDWGQITFTKRSKTAEQSPRVGRWGPQGGGAWGCMESLGCPWRVHGIWGVFMGVHGVPREGVHGGHTGSLEDSMGGVCGVPGKGCMGGAQGPWGVHGGCTGSGGAFVEGAQGPGRSWGGVGSQGGGAWRVHGDPVWGYGGHVGTLGAAQSILSSVSSLLPMPPRTCGTASLPVISASFVLGTKAWH